MARRKPLVAGAGRTQQLPSDDFIELGKLNLEPRETINAATTITVSSSFIRVRNIGVGTQDVETINGGERGDVLVIMRTNSGDDIQFVKNTGNLRGGPDRTLTSRDNILMLIKINNNIWNEVSFQG